MTQMVDYNDRLYRRYDAGRRLNHDAAHTWRTALARWLPPRRHLTVTELGCGTGRFSGLIADLGGGPVYAVEPSHRMRAIAVSEYPHPAVRYLAGRAEAIPLAAQSCDAVVMFFVLHHIADLSAAVAELSRVLRVDGRVLIAGSFSERLHPRAYYHYMPRAREVESGLFPKLATTAALFQKAGFALTGLAEVEHTVAGGLAAYSIRLGYRAISTFEYLTDEELNDGLAHLRADANAETAPQPIRHVHDLVTFNLTQGRRDWETHRDAGLKIKSLRN
jgi:ubiquinone/menaquinone biosynthesis C-methylase UbiE